MHAAGSLRSHTLFSTAFANCSFALRKKPPIIWLWFNWPAPLLPRKRRQDRHGGPAPGYAAMLPNGQYHLVTVGGHEYWSHRYEGALNGIGKAVVLLSYPKDAFGSKKALRAFICSDFGLSGGEILSHYTHRWKTEVMFKLQKMYMGLKSFMVRSARAIDRLLVILPLAHFFFIVLFEASRSLSAAIRRFRTLLCRF